MVEAGARDPARRAVVTGLGAVTGWGWGVAPLWDGLAGGRTAIRPIERFDSSAHRTHVASEVPLGQRPPDLDAARHASLADVFALAAAREALERSGLLASGVLPSWRTGVFFGSSTGGFWESEAFFANLVRDGRDPVLVDGLRSQQCNGPGDAVARRYGVGGPSVTISSACASGTLALGAALDAIREGSLDVALVGGADSLCQLTHGGFNALRSVDPAPCRPFHATREGLSIGEGAAVMVVESLAHATARGARATVELLGCGASCDASHMTAPDPEGRGPARAMLAALDDAAAGPEHVRFVNAHGTGTPLNDAAEWQALTIVFGEAAGHVPVTATKGSIGHLLGSSGAIEAVATVLCLERRLVHPTPGGGPVDGAAPVRLVLHEPLRIAPGAALSTSLAFGGSNAAAVFGTFER